MHGEELRQRLPRQKMSCQLAGPGLTELHADVTEL